MSVVSLFKFIEGPFRDRGKDNRNCRMSKDFGIMGRSMTIAKDTKGEF